MCVESLMLMSSLETDVQKALGRMAVNSVVSMLIVYCSICASYLAFYKAYKLDLRSCVRHTLANFWQGLARLHAVTTQGFPNL